LQFTTIDGFEHLPKFVGAAKSFHVSGTDYCKGLKHTLVHVMKFTDGFIFCANLALTPPPGLDGGLDGGLTLVS
jgi:hypothetical protein